MNNYYKNLPETLKVIIPAEEHELNSLGEKDPSYYFRKDILKAGHTIKKLYANYYFGWEMDLFTCITEKDNVLYEVTSNHGVLNYAKIEKT